jgi:GT2 family glycosyltransferase
MTAKVYILLLNWNGWRDTIECLESVFRLDYPDFRVIVCDNGSADGSLEKIRGWAEGRVPVDVPVEHPLHGLTSPPVAKPVRVAEYDRVAAEAGGDVHDHSRLVLIQTGANLGFAGGNNVGLRYALKRGDFSYVWLLNNDTVVQPDALSWLVARMAARPDAGMCGSTILLYDKPDTTWALGGGYLQPWLAHFQGLGDRKPYPGHGITTEYIESRLDYLAGASMLVAHDFLRDIGLMCEDYFLYFEEPDWAMRARGRYKLAFAGKSVLYHKVGASTALYDLSEKSSTANYLFRNFFKFYARFYPVILPVMAVKVLYKYLEYRYKRWKNPRTKLS